MLDWQLLDMGGALVCTGSIFATRVYLEGVENIIGSSLYNKMKKDRSYYDDFFAMERIINRINH